MSDDILINVKQINENIKSCLYLLYTQGTIAATSLKYEMDKFLVSEKNFISIYDENLEEVILIHGLVLDPAELPYRIPDDAMSNTAVYRRLWLIVRESGDSVLMTPYDNIISITENIEGCIEANVDTDITDVAVILGEEINLGLTVSKAGASIQAVRVYG